VTGRTAFTIAFASCLALVLLAHALQSTVVVQDVQFKGKLGVPVAELQEYTQFLEGHALEESKILKESEYAIGSALRHRGLLKAQVIPKIQHQGPRAATIHVVLLVTIDAGLQYRIKDIRFSGLAYEFSASELRNAIPLKAGDIADGEEIGLGVDNLLALFVKHKKEYFSAPNMTFDDAAPIVSLTFDILK
jgi:outer membrane protein assembly factor BamA